MDDDEFEHILLETEKDEVRLPDPVNYGAIRNASKLSTDSGSEITPSQKKDRFGMGKVTESTISLD